MKLRSKIISLVLCLCCALGAIFNAVYFRDENIETHGTVLKETDIDYMSLLDEFDEKELVVEEERIKLEAVQYLDNDLLSEIENLSYNDNGVVSSYIDYTFDFNSATNLIIVTISFYENDEVVSTEIMEGVPFINEEGKTDALFVDGEEIVYLSDFADLNQFQNCGFFSKLKKMVKKAANVVKQAAAVTAVYAIGAAAVCGVVAVTAVSAVTTAGTALPIGVPAAIASAGAIMAQTALIAAAVSAGSAVVEAGIEASENAPSNNGKESEKESQSKEATSQNQMQKQVEKGQAPKEVDRVDKKHNEHGQDHVHFKDGTSINKDGTIHDKGHGTPNLTNNILDWLNRNGWCMNGLQN